MDLFNGPESHSQVELYIVVTGYYLCCSAIGIASLGYSLHVCDIQSECLLYSRMCIGLYECTNSWDWYIFIPSTCNHRLGLSHRSLLGLNIRPMGLINVHLK